MLRVVAAGALLGGTAHLAHSRWSRDHPTPLASASLLALEAPQHAPAYRHQHPMPDRSGLRDDMELQAVQIICRHGIRAPLSALPGDTNEWKCEVEHLTASVPPGRLSVMEDVSLSTLYQRGYIMPEESALKGTCYRGQLMPVGRQQMEGVGAYLRETYVNETGADSPDKHLPAFLDASQVYIRSTDCKRTVETAQCLLNGLYPPGTRPKGKEGRLTIMSRDYKLSNMYGRSSCKRLTLLKKLLRQQPDLQAEKLEYDTLKSRVARALGVEKVHKSWAGILNTLDCMAGNNMPLPGKMTPEMVEEVRKASHWELGRYTFGTHEICSLSIGTFLGEVMEMMEETSKQDNRLKFMLYSGHDNTLSPILCGLKIFDDHPPMGSILAFELWRSSDTTDAFVRVVFNGRVRQLPGLPVAIPLHAFLAHVRKLVPDDYARLCSQIPPSLTEDTAADVAESETSPQAGNGAGR